MIIVYRDSPFLVVIRDVVGLIEINPWAASEVVMGHAIQGLTYNSRITSANASTAKSISASVCAADICVRMRAWSCGTTG